MPDIYHDLWIKDSPENVFDALASRPGLDHWWTLSSEGAPVLGSTYRLYFGPGYDWEAKVVRCSRGKEFEWKLNKADIDWTGTLVSFDLYKEGEYTKVRFAHTNWPEDNDHYRRSSYCWAMYLRALKRYIEDKEITPYDIRTSI